MLIAVVIGGPFLFEITFILMKLARIKLTLLLASGWFCYVIN